MLTIYFVCLLVVLIPIFIFITYELYILFTHCFLSNPFIYQNSRYQANFSNLATIYLYRKRWLCCIILSETSLSKDLINGHDVQYYNYIGLCYLKLKEYKMSHYHYMQSLNIDEYNTITLHALAKLYISMHQYNDAKQVYCKIINIDPDNQIANKNMYLLTKNKYRDSRI